MKYPQSAEILEKVKSGDKILLSCHHHPDSDTVGAAIVLASVFEKLGKEVKIICPDTIPDSLKFMKGSERIETHKFENFNFEEWDLYVMCDTSSWGRVFIDKNFTKPSIPVIVIDNHTSNKGFGTLNLIDYETSSVCEMLYHVLQDWGIEIDKDIAQGLLAGLVGDTGCFQYEVYRDTLHIADLLVKSGADLQEITYNLYGSTQLELIKFWGLAIDTLKIDPAGFAYIALPFEKYKEYRHIYGTRESVANFILSKIKNVEFGFILTEDPQGSCSVSLRSKGNVDTSAIASSLGGGGHPGASGAWLRETPFEEALPKVLAACREVAHNSNN